MAGLALVALLIVAVSRSSAPRSGQVVGLEPVRPGAVARREQELPAVQAGVRAAAETLRTRGESEDGRVDGRPSSRTEARAPVRNAERPLPSFQLHDRPAVLLRALDVDGVPLAERPLEVSVEELVGGRPVSSSFTVRSDSDGHFKVELEDHGLPVERRAIVVAAETPGGKGRGRLALDGDLEGGLHLWGDILLGPVPGFARGNVFDPAQGSVARTRLVLLAREGDAREWRRVPDFLERTGPDGGFEILAEYTGAEYRLVATRSARVGFSPGFLPGARDLRIDLRPETVIEGSIVAPEGVDPTGFRVVLAADSGETAHLDQSEREQQPNADGRFRFERLTAGLHRVVVRHGGDRTPLAEVRDVAGRPGTEARDPRLDPIDLAGRLFVHRLRLVAERPGTPLEGRITYGPAATGERTVVREVHGPDLELVTPWSAIDAEVGVAGYEPTLELGVAGRSEIQIVEGPVVRLLLRGEGRLPTAPIFVGARLVNSSSSLALGRAFFDESRELVVRAPGSGPMKVAWHVERRGDRSSFHGEAPSVPEQFVDVREGRAEQSFHVWLSERQMTHVVGALMDPPVSPGEEWRLTPP